MQVSSQGLLKRFGPLPLWAPCQPFACCLRKLERCPQSASVVRNLWCCLFTFNVWFQLRSYHTHADWIKLPSCDYGWLLWEPWRQLFLPCVVSFVCIGTGKYRKEYCCFNSSALKGIQSLEYILLELSTTLLTLFCICWFYPCFLLQDLSHSQYRPRRAG